MFHEFTRKDATAIKVSQHPPQFKWGYEILVAFRFFRGDDESELKARQAAQKFNESGGDLKIQEDHQGYYERRWKELGIQ